MSVEAEILRQAVVLINLKGWRQGSMRHGIKGICAMQAVWDAAAEVAKDDYPEYVSNIRKAMTRMTGFSVMTTWNDIPDRTKDHVVGLFNEIAGEFENE